MKKEFLITHEDPGLSTEEKYLRGIIENFLDNPTIYVTYCYRKGECYDLVYHVFLEEEDALEYMKKGGYKYCSTNKDGKRQFYQNGVMLKGMLTCTVMDLLDGTTAKYKTIIEYLNKLNNRGWQKSTLGVK